MKKYLVLALSIAGAILIAAGVICITLLGLEYENFLNHNGSILPIFTTVFGVLFLFAGIMTGFTNKE